MNFRLCRLAAFGFSMFGALSSGLAQPMATEPSTTIAPSTASRGAPVTTDVAPSGTGKVLSSAESDYVLVPGDTIEMTIFREPDLTSQSSIARDGTVQLPLIKEVKLAGLTVRDARDLLRKLYDEKYLVNPQVYLNIVRFSQRKFTILGQVLKPGAYQLEGNESLDLLEAIGMAGGFTTIADHRHIVIKRKNVDNGPDSAVTQPDPEKATPWSNRIPILGWFHARGASHKTSSQQRFQVITANATRMADGQEAPIMILPGDVITVGESWY